MKYHSKKDWWIGIALLIGFVAWIWFGTYYVFGEESLIIRCGPIKENVPYRKIISVKKTKNPLSSAALSIDRIEIRYGSVVLVSPLKKEEFLAELRDRCNYSFVELKR